MYIIKSYILLKIEIYFSTLKIINSIIKRNTMSVSTTNNTIISSRKIILEMLGMRGYDVTSYDNFSQKEIDVMIQSLPSKTQKNVPTALDMKCKHKTKDKSIHVLYNFSSKLKIQTIETILMTMIENETLKENDDVIILSKDTISNEHIFDSQLDALYKKMKRSESLIQLIDSF